MKIVVLAGGTSTERSVSITSGTMVCKALRAKNHQASSGGYFLRYRCEGEPGRCICRGGRTI